jgi:AcrR family transcriptional regulator
MTEATRPQRVDARRNYERLLAEARKAITADGVNASLEGIARAAGVGIGTLYRHFPTREALLGAVLREHFAGLAARAEELQGAEGPGARAALAVWLREFAEASTTVRGLSAVVVAALRDEGSELHAACDQMRAAVARLLARAQDQAGVRRDTGTGDVLAMAYAIAWVSEQMPANTDLTGRLMILLIDGLSPRPSLS